MEALCKSKFFYVLKGWDQICLDNFIIRIK